MSKRLPPAVYADPPGTSVAQARHGWEIVQKPHRTIARRSLTGRGRRKHQRASALQQRGWEIVSLKGAGLAAYPSNDDPERLASIAAAARIEGLK